MNIKCNHEKFISFSGTGRCPNDAAVFIKPIYSQKLLCLCEDCFSVVMNSSKSKIDIKQQIISKQEAYNIKKLEVLK